MPGDAISIALILLSLTVLGFAKGGFAGLGMLSMPLLAMVFPPVEVAAILMPVLIVQDAFSVWLYRKTWNRQLVAWMLPGGLIGVAAAAFFAASVSANVILAMLGVISISFGLWRLWSAHHDIVSGPFSANNGPAPFSDW